MSSTGAISNSRIKYLATHVSCTPNAMCYDDLWRSRLSGIRQCQIPLFSSFLICEDQNQPHCSVFLT